MKKILLFMLSNACVLTPLLSNGKKFTYRTKIVNAQQKHYHDSKNNFQKFTPQSTNKDQRNTRTQSVENINARATATTLFAIISILSQG